YHHSALTKLWGGLGFLGLTAITLLLLRKRVARGFDALAADSREFTADQRKIRRSVWNELTTTNKWTLAFIILLGIGLRWLYINAPLEYDESFSYLFFASKPLYVTVSYYLLPNNHILYNAFMHLSIQLFDTSAWAVRLPAFIFGVMAIPLSYMLGRRVLNVQTGMLAALLVSTSHWMIRYSTQGRGYSLQLVLILLMALLAIYLRWSQSRPAWMWMAVLAALTVHTVPTGVYPVAFIWIWLLFAMKKGWAKRIKTLVVYGAFAVGLTMLLYTPVFIVSGGRSIIANPYVVSLSFSEWLAQIPQWTADFHEYLAGPMPMALQIVLTLAVVAGIILHPWKKEPWPFIVPLTIVTLSMITIQQVHPFTRVWTWIVPFVAITAASGLGYLSERFINAEKTTRTVSIVVGIVLLVTMSGAELWQYNSTKEHRQTYELGMTSAAEWFNQNLADDDFVLWNMSFPVIGYYLDRDGDGREVLYSRSETDSGRVFFIHDLNRSIPVELAEAELDSSMINQMVQVFAEGNMTIHQLIR
ncbi:MAG TPA: hypothetical protein ENH10_03600, partial [Bacteroidetes bacterium]|nr:hypothetical protein [Bacteroidota bacterium]HEX04227.1 hypothetical protein [Bacteroidota bacterium]